MQKYVIALYIRLSLEDYKYDTVNSTMMFPVPVDAGVVLRFSAFWRMNAISAPMSSGGAPLLKWAAHGAA